MASENENLGHPSVSPVFARIVGETEVPSIGLVPLGPGPGVVSAEERWRVKGDELEQIWTVERRSERFKLRGWSQKLRSGDLIAGAEWESGSPEIAAWSQGKQRFSLWRSGNWLKDLVLRVPSL